MTKDHDDVIKWKHFPRYWPFVWGIDRSPVNSPHKVQWRGSLMFSLICTRINGWVNNREAGDLRHHRAHYDVTVMILQDNPRTSAVALGVVTPLIYIYRLVHCLVNWYFFNDTINDLMPTPSITQPLCSLLNDGSAAHGLVIRKFHYEISRSFKIYLYIVNIRTVLYCSLGCQKKLSKDTPYM